MAEWAEFNLTDAEWRISRSDPRYNKQSSLTDLFASWVHQRMTALERQGLLRHAKG
jgi:hypothetical protein